MAPDRQLSADFWLHEFPCYERANEADVAKLQETVSRVLQPVRTRWGRIVPTSWMWWSDGCDPRTGSHAGGGTIDFVTRDAELYDVFEWGQTHLLPTGYVGRWIYEPDRSAPEGVPQDEHIHMAPVQDMILHSDAAEPGVPKALEETAEGEYALRASYPGRGTADEPFRLPGITATARAGGGLIALLLLAGLAFSLHTDPHPV